MYDDQLQSDCNILPGGKCYYGSSSCQDAERLLNRLVANGTDWLWPDMEAEYNRRFVDG